MLRKKALPLMACFSHFETAPFCLQSAAGGGYRFAEAHAEQQRIAFDLHMETFFVNDVQFAAKKMPEEG